ncbi:MAG: VTT domain-containing protein [Chitinophagaceae bacterium]
MKRLLAIFIFCCVLILTVFFLFDGLEKWVEFNLTTNKSRLAYAILSFILLTSDIILPIPSSLVMILNGKVLGVLSGTIISFSSGLLSSLSGFYIGRKANPYFDKLFSKKDKEISNSLFKKFGNTAITISKALPIISEAISFVSGTTSVPVKTFLIYSMAGHFIVSLLYAYVGSYSTSLDSNLIAAIIILSALLIGWVMQLIVSKKATKQG